MIPRSVIPLIGSLVNQSLYINRVPNGSKNCSTVPEYGINVDVGGVIVLNSTVSPAAPWKA